MAAINFRQGQYDENAPMKILYHVKRFTENLF